MKDKELVLKRVNASALNGLDYPRDGIEMVEEIEVFGDVKSSKSCIMKQLNNEIIHLITNVTKPKFQLFVYKKNAHCLNEESFIIFHREMKNLIYGNKRCIWESLVTFVIKMNFID